MVKVTQVQIVFFFLFLVQMFSFSLFKSFCFVRVLMNVRKYSTTTVSKSKGHSFSMLMYSCLDRPSKLLPQRTFKHFHYDFLLFIHNSPIVIPWRIHGSKRVGVARDFKLCNLSLYIEPTMSKCPLIWTESSFRAFTEQNNLWNNHKSLCTVSIGLLPNHINQHIKSLCLNWKGILLL